MPTQEEQYNQYQLAAMAAQQQQSQSATAAQNANTYSTAMFNNSQKQNLVEFELDFKNELEDIERLLRCDILERDKDGNEYWIKNPDQSKIFLNDLGVNDILRKLRLLVNKGKVLSNYDIEEIRLRVGMIMHEIRILIYNNYEQYGMDNEYKWNNYSMIVLTIGSLVEDAYRRALNGETHRGLAEQRLVTQTEPLAPNQNNFYPQANNQPHGLSKLNPVNWFR
jgi:hypothetical protein